MYLVFSRTIFIIGFTITVYPIILRHSQTYVMANLGLREEWVPISRVTYAVYLFAPIFMLFS